MINITTLWGVVGDFAQVIAQWQIESGVGPRPINGPPVVGNDGDPKAPVAPSTKVPFPKGAAFEQTQKEHAEECIQMAAKKLAANIDELPMAGPPKPADCAKLSQNEVFIYREAVAEINRNLASFRQGHSTTIYPRDRWTPKVCDALKAYYAGTWNIQPKFDGRESWWEFTASQPSMNRTTRGG